MGYVRRLATTRKVEISEKLKVEIETAYLYGIVQKISEHKIPSSMVINLDQTIEICSWLQQNFGEKRL